MLMSVRVDRIMQKTEEEFKSERVFLNSTMTTCNQWAHYKLENQATDRRLYTVF